MSTNSSPQPERNAVTRDRTRDRAILGVILLLAAAARFWHIGDECFWIDEIFSLQTSAGNGLMHERLPGGVLIDPSPAMAELSDGQGLRGIHRYGGEDTQAPAYFIALNLWRHAFGSSETAVRALSALCSIGCVAALFALARSVSSSTTALLAAAVMALSGTQVVFAQEARPYAMALLWSLLLALSIVRIERQGLTIARGVLLAGSALLLVLTHYLGVAPAAAGCVYAMIRLTGRTRWRTLASFAAAGAVFLLLWGPVLLEQRRTPVDRLAFLNDNPQGHAFRTLDRALRTPLTMLIAAPSPSAETAGWRWAARAFGAAILVIPPLAFRHRRELLLPWLMAIVPIAFTAGSDVLSTKAALELTRFGFLSSAGVAMILALGITAVRPPGLHIAAVACVVVTLVASLVVPGAIGRPSPYVREKPNMGPMASLAARSAKPGDLLLLARTPETHWQAGTVLSALSHYLGESGGSSRWPGPVMVLDGPPDTALRDHIRSRGRVWLLSPTRSLPVEWLPPAVSGDTITVRNMGTLGRLEFSAPTTRPAGPGR